MARIHTITAYQCFPLQTGWELLSVAPGTYQHPEQLEVQTHGWLSTTAPGTVIETLQQHQQWDHNHPQTVDATDWWYRCTFAHPTLESGKQIVLKFAGLASIADAWLNGQHILHADNMFCAYEVDITSVLRTTNSLSIRFSALQSLLAEKRPRPRWRTQLVDQQQLRWFRTTLLGKMPGWSPSYQPVGPWRPIVLEERTLLSVQHVQIQTSLQGQDGLVSIQLQANSINGDLPTTATVVIDGMSDPLPIQLQANASFVLHGEIRVPDAQLWWPHTHGSQPLYPIQIVVQYPQVTVNIDCGKLAFRSVELLQDTQDDFGFRINGEPVFCRGACWTPLNIARLTGTEQEYANTLQMAQRAGMNMLRIGGTMVYEADAFYDLCDTLGILVWQDFMFANMDYPFTNNTFLSNAQNECQQLLERLQLHPCLALFCGNSEIQQQVAMLGLSPEMWASEFFDQSLPEICQRYLTIPYWPSSPSGGTLPFQANAGNSHYQGIGAFLKPLEDARRSEVRFASECLGIANVPEDHTLDLFVKAGELVVHHPQWKARTPRDHGAGWDFEDIRDYYLAHFFQIDPMRLRYSDMERYLALSRVTTGELMAAVFAEWRRQRSTCNGGLVWFYRDLWPGAGWGLLDATGYPKAAYYYLRRVSLAQACFFSDEGLNGLWLHVINDTQITSDAELHLALYRSSETLIASVTEDILLAPRSNSEIHVDALFKHFRDLTYAYRFGPPAHDLVVATLKDKISQQVISEAFYFPLGLPATRATTIGLQAQASALSDGIYKLRIKTEKFAQSVAIRTAHYLPEDNYFHIQPGGERTVLLHPLKNTNIFHISLSALNIYDDVSIYSQKGSC